VLNEIFKTNTKPANLGYFFVYWISKSNLIHACV
jgi:hypothetical protein